MKQKIFIFVVSLVVAFSFSTKNSWAGQTTTCNSGYYACHCSGDPPVDKNCCCSTAPPATATSAPPSCKYGSCSKEGDNKCAGSGGNYYHYLCDGDCWNSRTLCTYGCLGKFCAPPPAPTNTPVPTAVPCEGNDNNVCDGGGGYCGNECASGGIYARVRCSTNEACYRAKVYCNDSGSYNVYVGDIYCPSGLSPTPTTYCHPISCYSAPNSVCPGFDGSSCSGSVGNCDNCGGMSCGGCPGAPTNAPGPTPTTVPGCVSNCATNSCRNTICSDTTCLGSCGIYCYGVLSCNPPTFTALAIKNTSGTAVSTDASNRNQICETPFYSNASPRKVIFEASVADMDGYADIRSVQLRWNGIVYNMTFVPGSGSGSNAIYTATVDYTAVNNSGTYPLEINVTDSKLKTTGWVATNRIWKVWDCQIPVSGTVYDSSNGQSCNVAFLTTAPPEMNFNAITFSNVLANVPMAVNSPNYGSANLIWGQTYLPLVNNGNIININGDLLAASRFTQIIDTAANVTSCPATTSFNIGTYVSAYSANPSALIDFSFILNQEGWFQVGGAGVKAKNNIDSGVPVTMQPLSSRALSILGTNADNGLISYGGNFRDINGFNDNSAYGIPNDWRVNTNTNDSSTFYNYQYFYNNFLIKKGVGVTGTDWNGKPLANVGGVYFVDGDLNIDSNFTLNTGKFFMVVVRKKITIDPAVSNLDGIYVADGGIEALGTSDTQLIINGSLYSRKTIRLARSYTDKSLNNTSPAVKINYNPGLIFNMPGILTQVISNWREE